MGKGARFAPRKKGPRVTILLNKKRVALIAGVLAFVLLVVVGFASCVPQKGDASSSQSLGESAVSSSSAPAAKSAAEVEGEDTVPTVLPKTEDAGLEYAKETLFLGDSNTERMLYYSDVTGVTLDNGFGVVGMGISSFGSQGCARFEGVDGNLTMPQVVKLKQPRRVVMTFGSNNVGMQLERFIGDYKEAVAEVKKASPQSDIIVGGIFPVDQYRQNTSITMERINKMNEALAQMCDESGVKFLDWNSAMLNEENGHSIFEHTLQDGVHLTRSGMTAVFDYFRTHSYLTKDRRAGAAQKTPLRIGVQPQCIKSDPSKKAGPIDWAAVEAAKKPVTIVFSPWDETSGAAGGGSVSPGSVTVKPGGTSGAVTAQPKEGYAFVGWSFSSGTSGGGGATTTVSVNSAVTAGSTLTVTAVFRRTAPAPSSSSSSSSSEVVPSSSAAPVSQPPASTPQPEPSSQPAEQPPVSTPAPPASVPDPASVADPVPSQPQGDAPTE